jgi:hypothetical protein
MKKIGQWVLLALSVMLIAACASAGMSPARASASSNTDPSQPVPTSASPSAASAPAAPSATAEVSTQIDSSTAAQAACARFSQHEYEVCFAYLVNDTLLARVPFYQGSRSQAPGYYHAILEGCVGQTLGEAAKCRLWSRYYDPARAALEQQVAGWPGDVDVDFPRVSIVAVQSDLGTNTAIIQTQETWRVTAADGTVLFAENNQPHTITLRRVQGLALHKWVVISIK